MSVSLWTTYFLVLEDTKDVVLLQEGLYPVTGEGLLGVGGVLGTQDHDDSRVGGEPTSFIETRCGNPSSELCETILSGVRGSV